MPVPEIVVRPALSRWCRAWLSGRAGRASGDSPTRRPTRRATRRTNRTRPRSASARSSVTMQRALRPISRRRFPRSAAGTRWRVLRHPARRVLGRDPPRHRIAARGHRARPQPRRARAWPHSHRRAEPRPGRSLRFATWYMAPLARPVALPSLSRRRWVPREARAFVTPMRPGSSIRPFRSRAPSSVKRSPPSGPRCSHRRR